MGQWCARDIDYIKHTFKDVLILYLATLLEVFISFKIFKIQSYY